MRLKETMKQLTPNRAQIIGGMIILTAGMIAYGVPYTFTAGTTISASQMNANFTDVEATIAELETRLTAVEADLETATQKLASVSLEVINGNQTVRFTGVNLQVVNGLGNTDSANGTGNLIVGYDESETSGAFRCTLGTNPNNGTIVTDQNTCISAGGLWTNTGFKSGSHYLVAGSENNYSRWGALIVGFRNTSNYNYASVSGGHNNTSGGSHTSVSGGQSNIASSKYTSISGGFENTASQQYASVSGGTENVASGFYASVNGGRKNIASGGSTSICGGGGELASDGNVAVRSYSSILGGQSQTTSTVAQTIPALP